MSAILPSPAEHDNGGVIVPEWLSYQQATLYTGGLSRQTLWRAIYAGELEAAKVGRAIRISRSSLDNFLRSRCI